MPVLNYMPTSVSELEILYDNPTVFPGVFFNTVEDANEVTHIATQTTSNRVYAYRFSDGSSVNNQISFYPMRKFFLQPWVFVKSTSTINDVWLQIDPGHTYRIERVAYEAIATDGYYRIYKDDVLFYEANTSTHKPANTHTLFAWLLELES